MIGNPVSMPRVIRLVGATTTRPAGAGAVFFVVQVSEQEIMDSSSRPTATATSPAPTAANPWPG